MGSVQSHYSFTPLLHHSNTPVKIDMSIVTKTGDKGETSLMYGRRVPKDDPRVDAYGCVDELTAALGLSRALSQNQFVSDQILAVQKDLIVVMGELATLPEDRERYIKDGFQLASLLSAALDLARATCRRAERRVAILLDAKEFNPEILRYLNRLSDLCWILARFVEQTS